MKVSSAVKRCGTEQPDVVGRVLRAGPLSVEFDNGNLRYLKVEGIEVLRALSFLVRDENWGTYIPAVSGLVVDQRADSFSVRYHAVCKRAGQEIGYDATIEGRSDGSLEFTGVATPATDFLTARTGFVVLHPLQGVAGHWLEVEHVDGKVVQSAFPALVDPVQPFLNVRSLTHEIRTGLKAVVRMEGDTFEMEDHRNWTDASFKTYVRPLALPWPYTLRQGEVVRQSVRLTLVGKAAAAGKARGSGAIELQLGAPTPRSLPAVGLGLPAEEIDASLASAELLARLAPKLLICQFDPRQGHGKRELEAYRKLCESSGAACELEVVVQSLDDVAGELQGVASLVKAAGLVLAAVAVCPVGDLKSVLPGGARPPAPPLPDLYRAARAAFPGIKLGGGMFSFFTELNRKRPPADLLDFVHNSTCPIVHAADDRSVMETHEALPYQVATARSFIGGTAYRVGPTAIGCRDNPHGATFTPNPDNVRICLVKADPRQRALFGAAWTVGYAASLAPTALEALSFGAPTGPLGLIHRKGERAVPYYDEPGKAAVYPAYHVVAGLTRATGAAIVECKGGDASRVASLAYRGEGATLLWLANLTAGEQTVKVASKQRKGAAQGFVIDETTFEHATTNPIAFQSDVRAIDLASIPLRAYAVALVCIPDA